MNGLDSMSPMRSQGTADLIANEIRARILDGTFASGEQINEVHLAARLQVSRGPVREAVQRLVQEGLLVAVRNRSTSVVQLGPDDIADVYQGRLAIEREAARVVLGRGREDVADALDEVVGAMSDSLARKTWAEVARTDLSFHQTIVDAAGSDRLSRMFSTLVAETLLCMHRFERIFDPPGEIIDQHQRLADLLRSGDVDAYMDEIDWHLRNSVIRLTQAHGAATI
ncbi:DNA-binding transcriptional regulator, GntR family [Amycolatopsis marina]|uniref:DNA-binding transcriptional regulator, GntR family n=2 Tax=Amycolatopsis marina TaxID=490629 RepID=A0A1I0XV41_9PSEU|nr:DNA-binding transcriptional regulator, GntR family [Amycolatopsis marina]